MNKMVNESVKEIIETGVIDVGSTNYGGDLYVKYAEAYNLLMDKAEECGMDTDIVVNAMNTLREMSSHRSQVREELIRRGII